MSDMDHSAELEKEERQSSTQTGQSLQTDTKTQDHDHGVAQLEAAAATSKLPAREIVLIFCICMAQFTSLAGLATTIAPLQIIGRSFGVSNEGQLSWFTAAYSLTSGTIIMPAGRFGDMYGHRNLCVAGFIWFAIWSVVAGVSVYSGYTLFIVARAFQGIGVAMTVPNALAIAGMHIPAGKKKNMVFALFGASAPTGWVVGALFSSIFAQLAWWPWGQWALAFWCVVMAALCSMVLPKHDAKTDNASRFDFLGCATGVVGLVLVIFSLTQGASVGWETPYTYALLIVGVLACVGFAVVEAKFAEQPLVPIRQMDASVALALAVVAAGWASFGIWVYYLWQLIEVLRGYSPLAATAQNSAVAVSGLIAAVSTGLALSHIPVPVVLMIATCCFLVGQLLIATVPIDQIYWGQTFVSIIVMPFGLDMSFPSTTILVSNGIAKEHQGIAASLVNTAVNWSIAFGLALAGSVERYTAHGNQLRGFRGAWYLGVGLDGLGIVLAMYFVLRPYMSRSKSS